MANELIVTNAVALAALVDKSTGDTLTAAEYTTLKDSLQEANTATRAANVVFSGPTTGSAAAPTFRALVAADIPSLSYQPVDATLTAIAALGAGPGFLQVTAQDTFSIAALSGAQVNTALGYTAADNAALAGLQPLDATLTALAALATLGAANQIIRTNAGATALEWADPAGGISGLTTGVVPQVGSATTIVDSKMTTSGTNSGTWTLYDSAGETKLVLRQGSGSVANPTFQIFRSNGFTDIFSISDTGGGAAVIIGSGGNLQIGTGIYFSAGELRASSAAQLGFSSTTTPSGASLDIALARSAAGILKVTDGSTGYGRLLAGSLGVNNSAAGSTPGTCVKKIEVFDAAGSSLGFVPVYDAIT